MLSFLRKFFTKEPDDEINTATSINVPDYLTIESLEAQSGGGNYYYDNIYSRNTSKL